jgi:hypothetical protein
MSRFWRSFEFELGPPTLIHWPLAIGSIIEQNSQNSVYINWLIIPFIVDNRQ